MDIEGDFAESGMGYLDAESSQLSVADNEDLIRSSRTQSPMLNPIGAGGLESTPAPRFTVDKRINEEYKLWKKNIGFLYDTFMMTATQFPSCTVDWIPRVEDVVDEETGEEYQQQKIVLATTARNEDDSHLNGIVMMNVRFPKPGPDRFNSLDQKSTEFKAHVGLFTGSSNCMYTYGIIPLSFPLIHVRVMPQRPQLVCAKLFDSNIVIYDWEDELKDGWSYDDPILERAPMLELSGHETKTTNTSHGLVWNPTSAKEGLLSSCDKDGKILVWDVTGAKRKSDLEPIITITGHGGQVEDVAWHPIHPTLLGSVGLDKCFCLFDIRSRNFTKASHRVEAHTAAVNSISFAMSEVLLATASDDQTVALWDMRNLSRKLHSLQHHSSDVFTIDWCHDIERWSLIVSAGADRKVCIWDISQIGMEVERSLEIFTPPELAFVHGGHTGRVTDVCWNPMLGRKTMLASVAEDAIVQTWMPAKYQVCPIKERKWKGNKTSQEQESESEAVAVGD